MTASVPEKNENTEDMVFLRVSVPLRKSSFTDNRQLVTDNCSYRISSFQFSRYFFTSAMNWSATAPSMMR